MYPSSWNTSNSLFGSKNMSLQNQDISTGNWNCFLPFKFYVHKIISCLHSSLHYNCMVILTNRRGFPGGTSGKETACQCRRHTLDFWVGKIPRRRARQPAPFFLPGESHEQRSMVGYSPQDHRVRHNESDLACTQLTFFSMTWQVQGSSFMVQGRTINKTLPLPSGALKLSGRQTIYKWRSAAAKSLQSCPTLCDPIDGSPPGSPVSGILQARTLEWVAISFPNAWKWKVKVKSLSCVRLLATP